MHNTKEVYFYKYCKSCKHLDNKESDQPCESCLESGYNFGTHKPIEYEPANKAESLMKGKT